MALNFLFNTHCSNEQLKNVLLLFGFQDKCPVEFVLSRTFVLLQSKWKWAPAYDIHMDHKKQTNIQNKETNKQQQQKQTMSCWWINIAGYFSHNHFCNFYKFEGRRYNSFFIFSWEITASPMHVFHTRNPKINDLTQNIAKICIRDLSNNENRAKCCAMWFFWHSVYSMCTQTLTEDQRI